MPDPSEPLPHVPVAGRAENQDCNARRGGGGGGRIRDVDRLAHGGRLRGDLASAFDDSDQDRGDADDDALTVEELHASGTILVLTAAGDAFPLQLDSLERFSRHRRTARRPEWLLLTVQAATPTDPERAVVWVSDEYRSAFLKLFDDFLEKETKGGRPQNAPLIANIAEIRRATLDHLWQSRGDPDRRSTTWWELWLLPTDDAATLLATYAETLGLTLEPRRLELGNRMIFWIRARWDQLGALPFTAVPLTEVRRPEFVDTVEDLSGSDQQELTSDLADRTTPADAGAPAVCHLDSGVNRGHPLLSRSLDQADHHSVVDTNGSDLREHGTAMAGLGLYGDLEAHLLSKSGVVLTHRLESVKILPDPPADNDPLAYGLVTAEAAATVEVARKRRRAFCLPVTVDSEGQDGEPTLWSASVDALSAGTDIGQSDRGIALLGTPNPSAARLFVISAGNVQSWNPQADYLDECDLASVQDPAQAWNALTVGAYTALTKPPTDPTYKGWRAWAAEGELSPHSRTSLPFAGRQWPVKPDICMEGGNVLINGVDLDNFHPAVSLRTTAADGRLTSANATSAASAQAARLAAKAMAAYPTYWPETVRGLLTHQADWTEPMRNAVTSSANKAVRLRMLRATAGVSRPNRPSLRQTRTPSPSLRRTSSCLLRAPNTSCAASASTGCPGRQRPCRTSAPPTSNCGSRCRTSSSRTRRVAGGAAGTCTPRTTCASSCRTGARARATSFGA